MGSPHTLLIPAENRHIQYRPRVEIYTTFPLVCRRQSHTTGSPAWNISPLSCPRCSVCVLLLVRRCAWRPRMSPNGVFVPKGTSILLSSFAINRSMALWGADAEEFRARKPILYQPISGLPYRIPARFLCQQKTPCFAHSQEGVLQLLSNKTQSQKIIKNLNIS